MPHFVTWKEEVCCWLFNSIPKLSLLVATHRFIKIDAHRFAEYSMQYTASITRATHRLVCSRRKIKDKVKFYRVSFIYFLQISLIKYNQSLNSLITDSRASLVNEERILAYKVHKPKHFFAVF